MRRAFLLFLIGLCPAGLAQTLVFEHATVIDATGAPPKKDFTVVVRDGRIASVKPQAETVSGAVVIDATGKYLIPGLWDMHVHITSPEIVFPLLVANGITGVREMYSGFRWRPSGNGSCCRTRRGCSLRDSSTVR